MPYSPPPGTLRILQVVADNQGRSFGNVFWFNSSFDPGSTVGLIVRDMINDWQTIMDPLYSAMLTTATHGLFTSMTLYTSSGSFKESKFTPAIVGTVAGDECPSFVAICVQKRTFGVGPTNRGRWFFGPVPELHTDESFLNDPAPVTAIANRVTLPMDLGPATFTPVMFSKKESAFKAITDYSVDTVLATQKQRKVRV